MNLSRKGLALAVLQLILVASPYAKFKLDRARCPRIWVKTQSIDPYLPIRGRYVAMRLTVELANTSTIDRVPNPQAFRARLFAQDGHLAAEGVSSATASGVWVNKWNRRGDEYTLQQPVLFFLPEHAERVADLTTAARNGELWAEVTVPDSGLPRPIRVAIKRGESFTPIDAQ